MRHLTKNFLILLFILTILVGLVYAYPDLRFIHEARERYKGIVPIGFRDETVYLGRINAFYKGDYGLHNPAIYEHSKDPLIMPCLGEAVEAFTGKLFSLDVAETDMVWTFLAPALLFLLVFYFSYCITGMRFGALCAAWGLIFGPHLFSKMYLLSGKILNTAYDLPLWFMRPITPTMHFIFFLLALIFTWKTFSENKISPVLCGTIFLAALFYTSVFYWAYLYVLIAICAFIAITRRDFGAMKRMMALGGAAGILALPYLYANLQTVRNPAYPLLLERFNIAYTHHPIMSWPSVLLLGILFVFRKSIRDISGGKAAHFLCAMPLAVIVTLNQQVVTGKLFKESHWTTYTGKFVFIVVGIICASFLLKKTVSSRRHMLWIVRGICAIFFPALLFHAVGMQTNYYAKHFNGNLMLQTLKPSLDWVNANARPDDVVLPSPNDIRWSEMAPIYTKSFVYYSEPFFCMSLIPADETRYRMSAVYRLFGLSEEAAYRHPYAWDGALFLTNASHRTKEYMDASLASFIAGYRAMSDVDGLTLARKYKVDYVVALKDKDADAVRGIIAAGGKKVYEDPNYVIIKVG